MHALAPAAVLCGLCESFAAKACNREAREEQSQSSQRNASLDGWFVLRFWGVRLRMEFVATRRGQMFVQRTLGSNWLWVVAIILAAGSVFATEELRWLLAGVLALGCIIAVLIRVAHRRAEV